MISILESYRYRNAYVYLDFVSPNISDYIL